MEERIKTPAECIREEMEKHNLTQLELANKMGIKKQNLNNLFTQHRRITFVMAVRLSNAMPSTKPEYWIKVQTDYDVSNIK